MELFDRQGLMEATKLSPRKLKVLMYLLKAPVLDRIYSQLSEKQGINLIADTLKFLNIRLDYDLEALERTIPEKGPFITVSNHPFGFLDGIILLLIIGRKRKDFRVVANFLLSYFAPISDLFITVNPFEQSTPQGKRGPKGMGGAKKSLKQIEAGHGLGIFPAGEVSTWYKGQKGIEDRPWPLSSMRLIKNAQVPVIPVYFHGHNSRSFHVLGKVHPALRTLRIPAEFLKKKNSTIHIGFGEPIAAEEILACDKPEAIRELLRDRVYQQKEKFTGKK
ncbi:lysophospholipid acyltransferase family protein [Bacterioplanoides sp.]|uniref:lysophospholipid acyltransferase family protein n=1 Tax=Bacterioplanoides sp. TaxID=2066072 RepID=UPI003B00F2C9